MSPGAPKKPGVNGILDPDGNIGALVTILDLTDDSDHEEGYETDSYDYDDALPGRSRR